jgi:hypothetical protein
MSDKTLKAEFVGGIFVTIYGNAVANSVASSAYPNGLRTIVRQSNAFGKALDALKEIPELASLSKNDDQIVTLKISTDDLARLSKLIAELEKVK